MISRCGKLRYLCPECNSIDISHCRLYGQDSGVCHNTTCNTWWPWDTKQEISIEDRLPSIKVSESRSAIRIFYVAILVSLLVIGWVFATGQTFGQRCASLHEPKSVEWHACIDKLVRGE